jgi:hypothetical protein
MKDGWMVSDFYMWKSVLKGMGQSKTWITCEEPSKLVAKYGLADRFDTDGEQVAWKDGYFQEGPFEERAVAFD